MVRAYIGLGANLGDERRNLAGAVRALGALPGARLHGVSDLYRTRPVGVSGQPDYLNAVVALDVPKGDNAETGALALLAGLKSLEQALGRQPRERWGPREIDLDLLLFGRHALDVARPDGRWLVVPHPLAHERLFVLAPLADLVARLRPPGWHASVADVRDQRAGIEGPGAVTRIARWQAATGRWLDLSGQAESDGSS